MGRVRRLGTSGVAGLSGAVWRVQAGVLVNSIGTGFVLPFTVIYFHQSRGFSLPLAGLVVALMSAAGSLATPLAGALSDRFSPRATLIGALIWLAAGYGLFAFVRTPVQALGVAAVAGAGGGAYWPAANSLLVSLARGRDRAVAFSLERTVANLGYGIGALLGGLAAADASVASFQRLFLADAVTFLLYLAVVATLGEAAADAAREGGAEEPGGARPTARGYRRALRDRPFVLLLVVSTVLLTAGYSVFERFTPVYAHDAAHVSTSVIGVLFLVNCLLIVVFQLPVTAAARGRSRPLLIGLLGVAWAGALGLILLVGASAGAGDGPTLVVLFAAFAVFTVGESLQSAVIAPLAADLAPGPLAGRYLALYSLTWQIALTAGPAIGGLLLEHAPALLWAGAAVVCLVAAGCTPLLGRMLPAELRHSPS